MKLKDILKDTMKDYNLRKYLKNRINEIKLEVK